MSSLRIAFAVFTVAALFMGTARAADPTGTWRWSQPAPGAAAFASPREASLVLDLRNGVLSGSLSEVDGETIPIDDARLRGDNLSFTVTSSLHGTVAYEGRVDGDTIRGTMRISGLAGGEDRTLDWVAVRDG